MPVSSLTRDFTIFEWKKSQAKDTNFEVIGDGEIGSPMSLPTSKKL